MSALGENTCILNYKKQHLNKQTTPGLKVFRKRIFWLFRCCTATGRRQNSATSLQCSHWISVTGGDTWQHHHHITEHINCLLLANYLHKYLTATLTNIAFCFGFLFVFCFNSFSNSLEGSGLDERCPILQVCHLMSPKIWLRCAPWPSCAKRRCWTSFGQGPCWGHTHWWLSACRPPRTDCPCESVPCERQDWARPENQTLRWPSGGEASYRESQCRRARRSQALETLRCCRRSRTGSGSEMFPEHSSSTVSEGQNGGVNVSNETETRIGALCDVAKAWLATLTRKICCLSL